MPYENETLGALLSDPRIELISADAVRGWNLKKEPLWNKTLSQLRDECGFIGEIGCGIERLLHAAETGKWYYPLYSEEECAEDPACKGVNIVWFPSEASGADDRPFIFLVPGGGFVHVWSLTEGWPVAAQFNRLGYHVFILSYRVEAEESLLEKNMEDFARALRLIKENEECFHLRSDRYITCGFSAGGYLAALWNTAKGYPGYDLPKPQASFLIYPVISLKEGIRYVSSDPAFSIRLFGCPFEEAAGAEFEIPEHAEGFPPCAVFLAAEDELVDPENSRMLAAALEKLRIPVRLEIGPAGGHGFADGSGMCMAGWTERAVRWAESLDRPPCSYSFIWDMDGTLVDSYPAIVPAVQAVCREYGLDYSAGFIHEYVIRTSVGDLMKKIGRDHGLDPAVLVQRFNVFNDSRIEAITAMPHAEETLRFLAEAGHRNFVYTHRGASCRAILKQTGLEPYFTEVVTALDGFPRKPAPDAILYLMEKYALTPSHCFYVGDRSLDVEAANNAGIGSILYLEPESPITATGHETHVVADLLEICEIV